MVIALTLSSSAHATPASPGDIEAQIDAAWNKLEPLIEQDNNVKAQLADNQTKAAQLADQIRPLQLQVDLAMGRVGSISAQAYKDGSASQLNALLTSSTPGTLADQLSLLDAMAKSQQAQIAGVAKAKAEYDAKKKPLDALVKTLSAQETQIVAQEKTINDQIAQYNQLRLDAYGTTNTTGVLRPAPCPATYSGGAGSKAAQIACHQIGTPYVFGAAGPKSFDCSGLVLYSWAQATGGKVSLYHFTRTQYSETRRVSRAELIPGDVVFYFPDNHHEAIYVGDDWVVQAPRSGEDVKMTKIDQIGSIYGYGRPSG